MKWIEYILVVVLTLFVIIKGIVPGWNVVHSDFANYYVSASIVAEGDSVKRLYDNRWFQTKITSHGIRTQGKFSPFPPITAWIALPLTPFSPLAAQRAMVIVNVAFAVLCSFAISRIAQVSILQSTVMMLGAGIGLANNIAFGQVYLIMTTSILIGIFLIKKDHLLPGSAILTTFTAIKYFPAVVLGSYFLNSLNQEKGTLATSAYLKRKDTRVVFIAIICGAILTLAQLVYFGGDVMIQFASTILLPHLDGMLSDQGLYTFHYQSWDNFLRILFIRDDTYNPNPLMDWPEGKTIVKAIILILVLILVIKAIQPYQRAEHGKRLAIYLTVITLATLVMLPITATYHFVLLIVPVTLILANDLVTSKWRIAILILYFATGFIPYGIAFDLGIRWGLFFAYPRLWLVTTIFIVVAIALIQKSKSQVP